MKLLHQDAGMAIITARHSYRALVVNMYSVL